MRGTLALSGENPLPNSISPAMPLAIAYCATIAARLDIIHPHLTPNDVSRNHNSFFRNVASFAQPVLTDERKMRKELAN